LRRWRDTNPNQHGDNPRGHSDGPPTGRRRAGPQAVNFRTGETRGSDTEEDQARRRIRRRTGGGRSAAPTLGLPMEPRALAIVGAAAIVLVVLAVLLTRAISPSSPEPTPAPAAVVVSPTAAEPTAVPTQGPIQSTIVPLEPSYTVQAGDTLASIARRFNTTVDAIVSINNLTDRNALRVGQRLIIPTQ
jgi:LysM repeat protein